VEQLHPASPGALLKLKKSGGFSNFRRHPVIIYNFRNSEVYPTSKIFNACCQLPIGSVGK
jgi:hypothetical protein